MTTLVYPFGRRRNKYLPLIPVILAHKGPAIEVYAQVDSGADTTIFSEEVGELLKLDVKKGTKRSFRSATGHKQPVYYHKLTLQLEAKSQAISYDAVVGFAQLPPDVGGLLGLIGFFDHFIVTINQSKKLILLQYTG